MRKPLTAEQSAHLLEMYANGKGVSLRQCAKVLEINAERLRRHLVAQGVSITPQVGRPNEGAREIAHRAYCEGKSTHDCAALAGVYRQTVGNWIRDLGWRRGTMMTRPKLHVPSVRERETPVSELRITTWRCVACGARVSHAEQCPNGHVAPWAEAA